ncbi:hypothetical protein MKW94_022150 [Papaver nudicaule]|uniref:TCTP domain-containing protein n=1 Tax=Papaver nudicaule TaxID=74823 RepID=A0AA41UXB6_PAPNU|nr:hypothetical protein [Papaver nudicaule]
MPSRLNDHHETLIQVWMADSPSKEKLWMAEWFLQQFNVDLKCIFGEIIMCTLFLRIQCIVQGAVDVNIGANPSAEGADADEGVDDTAVKCVDIVDTFRLQEQPAFDKKQFVAYIKRFMKTLTPKLSEEDKAKFNKGMEAATKYLLPKLKDLQFFVGESMHDDATVVFAYYKEGASDPTFVSLKIFKG